ncbi:MAG: SprT-like domain-containing protein [Bacteroidales bacterium]|nr:SprT-like domain-containing protein [Bacteroidales bacterium]
MSIDWTDNRILAVAEALTRYVPEDAVRRLTEYIATRGVHLRITRQRMSKYGDYKPTAHGHHISVNGNLNKYFFLLVMLHEMAHLENYLSHGRRVEPHGHEWQQHYARIIKDYIDCFPADIRPLLQQYISRIPLNHKIAQQLDRELLHYGETVEEESPTPVLDQLPPGTLFRLYHKPQRLFRNIEKKRTRWVCRDEATGGLFSVNGNAEVIVVA